MSALPFPIRILRAVSVILLTLSIVNITFSVRISLSPSPLLGKVFGTQIISSDDVILPIRWGDIGEKLVMTGVIDREKLEKVYGSRGGLTKEEIAFLTDKGDEPIIMSETNANFVLNLLWAFGLANKNEILEKGEMADMRYGGPQNFASTGGWTLASGDVMNHFSKHEFVKLTPNEQALVDRVSKNIYRPCCDNPTHFPDCNHGMAMLGLLELMAANGVSEQTMYRVALSVNTLWFPDVYLTIQKYLDTHGSIWQRLDPKTILGPAYSSASGYQRILREVKPVNDSSGGSCGV